jgi:phospholipid transport system transporter-binding protein
MTTLALPSKLLLADAAAAARELAAQAAGLGAGQALVFDARGLQSFDSSAFAVMLDVMRSTRKAGGGATVLGAPASMVQLAKLYGVDELLTFDAASVVR